MGEDSMNSQNGEYDENGWSEDSTEEVAEDTEDNQGDYVAQRSIERGYEFVESQPAGISLSNMLTKR